MKAGNRNPWLLILFLAIGVVAGGLLGHIFGDDIRFLGYGESIGFKPVTIDLAILKVTVGFMLNLNVASIVGIALAIFAYTRL